MTGANVNAQSHTAMSAEAKDGSNGTGSGAAAGAHALRQRERVSLWCFALLVPLRLKGWKGEDGIVHGAFYTGAWLPFFKTHVSWAKAAVGWHEGWRDDRERALLYQSLRPEAERTFERRVIFSLSRQTQLIRGLVFDTRQLILGRWAFWITPDPPMPRPSPHGMAEDASSPGSAPAERPQSSSNG